MKRLTTKERTHVPFTCMDQGRTSGENRISTSLSNPVISPVDEEPVTLEALSLAVSNRESEPHDERNELPPGSLTGKGGDSNSSSPTDVVG